MNSKQRRKLRRASHSYDIETCPIQGRHYDTIVMDDLLGSSAVVSNASQSKTPDLTLKILNDTIEDLKHYYVSHYLSSLTSWFAVHPRQQALWRTLWQDWKEASLGQVMADKIPLYQNVLEAEYGVKLCVRASDITTDYTTMEILVPNKLLADDKGKESLAEALHNVAMFILSLESEGD